MTASQLRPRKNINYREMNDGFSTDMCLAMKKSVSDRIVLSDQKYYVERLIWKKDYKKKQQYLVKWKDYHIYDSTWEPEDHIPRHLVVKYCQPDIEDCRKEQFARAVERTTQARLKSKNPKPVIFVDLDIYRSCFGNESKLCALEDFNCLDLSEDWYYRLHSDGSGVKLRFPVRLTPTLHVRNVFVCANGELVKKSRPIERCTLFSSIEACTANQL